MHRREFHRHVAAVLSTLGPVRALAQSCSAGPHPATVAERAAHVRIVDSSLCPGDWRRYGADPSGLVDSTIAIQAACSCNAVAFDSVGGIYAVSSTITVPSGVTLLGAAGRPATLKLGNGDVSLLLARESKNVRIQNLRLTITNLSTKGHTGAVEFRNCSDCSCSDLEISGCSWTGVLLHESDNCKVSACFFHDFLGEVHDSSDILVYRQSHHNRITNNRCMGGNWHGIAIQDPYAGSTPHHNVVSSNVIGRHKAYGIMVYTPTAGDTFNEISGNSIEGIQGSVLDGASGAGIYVAGLGSGGTALRGNTIQNCCVQTRQRVLAPAGIGVNGLPLAGAQIEVTNNTVSNIDAYDGILVVSCKGPIVLSGNTVSLAVGNSSGTPIQLDASSHVKVINNVAQRSSNTRGRCIFVYANDIAVSDVTVTGNTCSGSEYPQIEFATAGSGSISDVVCTNNTGKGRGDNNDCVHLSGGVRNAMVSSNRCVPGA